MTERRGQLIKLLKKALRSASMPALSYSFDQPIINNEMSNRSLELEAIEFTVENHTLLHEAEFAGRIECGRHASL